MTDIRVLAILHVDSPASARVPRDAAPQPVGFDAVANAPHNPGPISMTILQLAAAHWFMATVLACANVAACHLSPHFRDEVS